MINFETKPLFFGRKVFPVRSENEETHSDFAKTYQIGLNMVSGGVIRQENTLRFPQKPRTWIQHVSGRGIR